MTSLAVITGATSGIGAEFARQLAAAHQTLWLIGRRHVHVQATLKISYAALNVMAANGNGSIINVSSVAAFVPTPTSPLYGPTKAFIRSLSESLAITYEDKGIRVQALCPGYTITDFHERIGLDPDTFYRKSGLMRAWTSEYTVRQSLIDLRRGKIVSVPGWNYRLIVMLLRRLPLDWLYRRARKGDESHRPEQE